MLQFVPNEKYKSVFVMEPCPTPEDEMTTMAEEVVTRAGKDYIAYVAKINDPETSEDTRAGCIKCIKRLRKDLASSVWLAYLGVDGDNFVSLLDTRILGASASVIA